MEIRKPAKSTFVLKAMAKMLMKRDREHNEEEQRRQQDDTADEAADSAQKEQPTRQTTVDDEAEDELDDDEAGRDDVEDASSRKRRRMSTEPEDMHISEMEDDEASDEDTRQQRTRSHYRHNSPLPPLTEELSVEPAGPAPPSLPSPPSLSPAGSKKLGLATLLGSPSPSSPAVRPVKPSSRSRPLPSSLQLGSGSASSAPPTVSVAPPSRETRRPVSLIQSISAVYPLQLLLAEDNHINVRLMCMLLGKLGYNRVKVALNGVEVLKALSRTKGWKGGEGGQEAADGGEGEGQDDVVDVVLMDCQMDEMDGMDCTSRIRQHETGAKQPTAAHLPNALGHYHYICAQTANVSAQYRDMCSGVGMDNFISKPVAVEQLRDVLQSAWQFQHERKKRCTQLLREWRERQQARGEAEAGARTAVEIEVDRMREDVGGAQMKV